MGQVRRNDRRPTRKQPEMGQGRGRRRKGASVGEEEGGVERVGEGGGRGGF